LVSNPGYENRQVETNIFDFSIINNYLIVLFTDGIKILNLDGEIAKSNFTAIPQNIENMSRLLKISDKHCLIVSDKQYALLQLPNFCVV
jgi:uncharacterized protein with WD repeat